MRGCRPTRTSAGASQCDRFAPVIARSLPSRGEPATAAAGVAAGGCGERSTARADRARAPTPRSRRSRRRPTPSGAAERDRPRRDRRRAGRRAAPAAERESGRRSAERAYRAYIDAINERDGEALCALLAPGLRRELRPPVDRGDCAASAAPPRSATRTRAAIPVWSGPSSTAIESVVGRRRPGHGAPDRRRSLTEFEDRDEPSVESDIAYLELRGGELAPRPADGGDLPGDRPARAPAERDRSAGVIRPDPPQDRCSRSA